MKWLKKLFGSDGRNGSDDSKNAAAAIESEARQDPMMTVQEAWNGHSEEISGHLSPAVKVAVLETWREYIDKNAHDYLDLVASHEKMLQITELEVDTMMRVYVCGFMAKRGWIEDIIAQQMPFMLGRNLRDQIRSTGISLDSLSSNTAVMIDRALRQVLQLGTKTEG
jgi:hypothetical protein